ncbi:hypothetical protein V2J09_003109 [Rumex salicifolius]
MTLDGGALMGFHQDSALLSKQHVGPMVVFLMLGFCALFAGLIFQESCPEFAVVVAALLGAASVIATFLTMIAAILAPMNLNLGGREITVLAFIRKKKEDEYEPFQYVLGM